METEMATLNLAFVYQQVCVLTDYWTQIQAIKRNIKPAPCQGIINMSEILYHENKRQNLGFFVIKKVLRTHLHLSTWHYEPTSQHTCHSKLEDVLFRENHALSGSTMRQCSTCPIKVFWVWNWSMKVEDLCCLLLPFFIPIYTLFW